MIKIQLYRTDEKKRVTLMDETPIMKAMAKLLLVYCGESFEFKIISTLKSSTKKGG